MGRLHEIYCLDQAAWRRTRREAKIENVCALSGTTCDGGGNRHQTSVSPVEDAVRRNLFVSSIERGLVPGICSIKTGDPEPWIVCPHRLFAVRHSAASPLESWIAELSGISRPYAIWSEVTFQVAGGDDHESIKYRFDYVMSAVRLSTVTGGRSGEERVANPIGPPFILEVMTASTSGSKKEHGTDIATAFLDSLGGTFAVGPNINKRQVWARMASQLIAKSELAAGWGGRTYWLLQSNLLDYIARTTAMDLRDFRDDEPGEVSIISLPHTQDGGWSLKSTSLASRAESQGMGVYGLFHTPIAVPLEALHRAMLKKQPVVRS